MGSMPPEFPLSLRAWPSIEDQTRNLPSLIERINLERGGFQTITEESLRKEIAEAEAAAASGDANGKNAEAQDESKDEKADRQKELQVARDEILMQIEQAHMSSIFALNFVSLLLSKDTPVQASLSISPFLKDTIPMGTLGADKLPKSRITEQRRQENKQIAKGWKIQNVTKAVDSILAAATRLEKEIELEAKYWDQVLAVSERGWAICRMPQEKHTLGVRFGFSEAAPAFRNRSLAAMRRNNDGSVSLDQDRLSSEPKRLRVRVETEGKETGRTSIPQAVPEDAPIEQLILQARNTIYAEELWQELNREARSIASEGVRANGETVTCPLSSTKTMIIDLISLDTKPNIPPSNADNVLADALSLALGLLLSYAHRQSYRRRTQPPPPLSATIRPTAPYALLKPIISRLHHEETIQSLHGLLKPICNILKSSAIRPSPAYTLVYSTPPQIFPQQYNRRFSSAEFTIASLTDRLEAVATLTVLPGMEIQIKFRTNMFPIPVTTYALSLQPDDNPLARICKSPPVVIGFQDVKDYVLYAVSCALASSFVLDTEKSKNAKEGLRGWQPTSQGNVLRKTFEGRGKCKQFYFDVYPDKEDKERVTLRVNWEWSSVGDSTEGREKNRKGEGRYAWKSGKEGEKTKSIEEVVEEAGLWEL
ncbi:subunit 17 of mediator complex-domain-containing protein [Xylogone sp. PMI_703]|nr:subunit 17 of mediator complex-domain-containing protein [Xylogone sp. PMI_703]